MNKIDLILDQHLVGSLLSKKIDLALSVHGINLTEFILMHHLSFALDVGLNRISLANKVALTASGITRVLQPMEKIGLIEKATNPRDARQSFVVLTQSGRTLLDNATTTVKQTIDSIFSLLDENEIQNLKLLLSKLKI
ncbi:MarR family transcriptional regulator [Acinetobacter sp.]|uniref:MarR family winged helix-turn-helix transcriptional regulator n=1 Tax=Acinetobacter sp. TaxID=472 RepID=UPI0031D0D272